MFKESYVSFIAFNTRKTQNSVSRKSKRGIGSHKPKAQTAGAYPGLINFYLSSIAWGVVAQSPKPVAHVLNARAFRIELEFRNVGFCGVGKTGVPGEKPLRAEKRTNNKLNPHMTSSPGIEPGPDSPSLLL